MKYQTLIAGVALVSVLSGCGKSDSSSYKPEEIKPIEKANVSPGQEATLFPLSVGNTWRYETSISARSANGNVSSKSDINLEVKKVTPIDGGVLAVIEVSKGEVLQDRQTWRVDKTGIHQEELGLDTPRKSDGLPAVVFPIEIDKPVEWKGTAPSADGKQVSQEGTVTCKGVEEVDTMMGTMSAYRVEQVLKAKDDKGNNIVTSSVVYWVPNVGLVRQKQDVKVITKDKEGKSVEIPYSTQLMVLKQKTVK